VYWVNRPLDTEFGKGFVCVERLPPREKQKKKKTNKSRKNGKPTLKAENHPAKQKIKKQRGGNVFGFFVGGRLTGCRGRGDEHKKGAGEGGEPDSRGKMKLMGGRPEKLGNPPQGRGRVGPRVREGTKKN